MWLSSSQLLTHESGRQEKAFVTDFNVHTYGLASLKVIGRQHIINGSQDSVVKWPSCLSHG